MVKWPGLPVLSPVVIAEVEAAIAVQVDYFRRPLDGVNVKPALIKRGHHAALLLLAIPMKIGPGVYRAVDQSWFVPHVFHNIDFPRVWPGVASSNTLPFVIAAT